jgi:hypothetical protein
MRNFWKLPLAVLLLLGSYSSSELTLNASGELCASEEYWCEGAGGDFNITQCIYPTCQFSCYFHAGNVHYDTCEME